jgi:hypothetical protein
MDDEYKSELEKRITRLYTAAAELTQIWANPEPLQPNLEVPVLPAADFYTKAIDIEEQIKSLLDEFRSKY